MKYKKQILNFVISGIILMLLSGTASSSVTNVAYNKEVTLHGASFFTGGWAGAYAVDPITVVDGNFLLQYNEWGKGPVWWNSQDLFGLDRYIKINLNGIYNIESFIIQADDNDAYELYYWDLLSDDWQLAWDVPNYDVYNGVNIWGMQTRPNPYDNLERYVLSTPIITNALKFKGNMNSGDRLFSISELQAFGQLAVVTVNIDIKPGSEPNSFNNNGKGVIPVAILGSQNFDVKEIDAGSVTLEGMAIKFVGKSDKLLAHYGDVNGDSILDLIIQIEDIDGTFTLGETIAKLTGYLLDGTPIEGQDSISIVP